MWRIFVMIRKLLNGDIDRVADIWLKTNLISFYQREGFIIQCEGLDEATGEKEYTMLWKQK